MIVANPNIGYTTLALLVGIAFILNGIAMAVLGWGLHEVREDASKAGPVAGAA